MDALDQEDFALAMPSYEEERVVDLMLALSASLKQGRARSNGRGRS